MRRDIFDLLLAEARKVMAQKPKIYAADKIIGTDINFALPLKIISDRALSVLFADNMFLPKSRKIYKSVFYKKEFRLLVLPYDKIKSKKYHLWLKKTYNHDSDIGIVMDLDRRIGLIFGSSYCGAIKKLLFTVMNYLLPLHNVLPLHCSANEDIKGNTSLFLGLSGTGKTTLSSDKNLKLIGDDEHWWSDYGISNFEYGCYAKLINLNRQKEPEIFRAVFSDRHYLKDGTIIENAMIYPNGIIDLNDGRLTENSRVSYPLKFLKNAKLSGIGKHPKRIIFLTSDANGVLPPVAKLSLDSALLWFLMGYTSKLAGTEIGTIRPINTFSRFFGEPFMPNYPRDYLDLFKKKLQQHKSSIYLVNTGWTGGPYGIGHRIDIAVSKKIVNLILQDRLDKLKYKEDNLFHLQVPRKLPGIKIQPLAKRNWKNKNEYRRTAVYLAAEFRKHFTKFYSGIGKEIKKQCPGF